jgi:tetratricopeptide (TPR) repeat protein
MADFVWWVGALLSCIAICLADSPVVDSSRPSSFNNATTETDLKNEKFNHPSITKNSVDETSPIPAELQSILKRMIQDSMKTPSFVGNLNFRPNDVDALGEFAMYLIGKNALPEAEIVLRHILHIDPKSVLAHYELHAILSVNHETRDESANLLEEANRLNPNYASWKAGETLKTIESLAEDVIY